jgi:hypothetical protein
MPERREDVTVDLSKKFGGILSAANEAVKDTAPNIRSAGLPPNIRGGVAKLSAIYMKQQTDDDKLTPKGEYYLRASAIVTYPLQHSGMQTKGSVTQQIIPLCDTEAKGRRPARSFKEYYYDKYRSLLQSLGAEPCPETQATDPTGARTWAYWQAAIRMILERAKKSALYISFSTSAFSPEPESGQAKREPLIMEYWHGLAPANGQPVHDPASKVQDDGQPTTPHTLNEVPPPAITAPMLPAPTPTPVRQELPDPDVVMSLLETVLGLPDDDEDGIEASRQLEKIAWTNGWSREQTKGAAGWEEVGEMALSRPPSISAAPASAPTPQSTYPSVGTKHKYRKRTKAGEPLKNAKGEEFPALDVEIVSVDTAQRTCNVKTKDGKVIADLRSKEAVAVKFEWLE